VAKEAAILTEPDYASVVKLKLSREVFCETLRLYPPVPMMVRQSRCPATFRNRKITPGSQMVISPWHLHRHIRLWGNPDGFDPSCWRSENGKACLRDAYIPFSTGVRVCVGAGFAMVEGPLLFSLLLKNFRFESVSEHRPTRIAYLAVRSNAGIWLKIHPRSAEFGAT
jgi:cytochrome P450